MVAAIAPLVGGAYCLVGLFYSTMATLGGQGRPLPVALAFFFGAFLVAPSALHTRVPRDPARRNPAGVKGIPLSPKSGAASAFVHKKSGDHTTLLQF